MGRLSPSDERVRLLRAAEEFAFGAGEIVLRSFGTSLPTEEKSDGTPVTEADRAAEEYLRQRIRRHFPTHRILGEEFGETGGEEEEVRWILDPIDGTVSFLRGVPLFGVLVGIEIEHRPVVGVAHFPALRETVTAALGVGCFWNGKKASVSSTADLARAAVLATDPRDLLEGRVGRAWERLVRTSALARTWGDCYGHILVATGRAEVMIDPVLSTWDAAALLPILEEAGGRFTDLGGESRIDGGSGISTNGILHQSVLALFRAPSSPD